MAGRPDKHQYLGIKCEMTYNQVALELGISRETVRKIEADALRKLRRWLKNQNRDYLEQ